MPRVPGSRIDLTSRDGAQFAMMLPQKWLAHVSSAALTKIGDFDPVGRRGHEWQRDAYTYNELIGEVGYLHNLTASLVAMCDFRIMEQHKDERGLPVAEASDDERALRVMAAFTGPLGGQKELKRRSALHYQIAGESYLLGTPLKDEFGMSHGVSWEFLSTEEIKIVKDGNRQSVRRNSAGMSDSGSSGGAETVDPDAYIARLWRPDPRYSLRADSPLKRVLPICRELVVLGEVIDGVAKSRLSSGLLFVPEELSFGPIDEGEEEGSDADDLDRFIEALVEHMKAPVEDRTSAAGLVPLVVKGAAEFGDKIRLIELAHDLDTAYQPLREELLKRIAQGLDAPPEIIHGKASLNHWSAYNIDTDFVEKHVEPIGEAIAEFLTVAYLRPMLVEFEEMTEDEVNRFFLEFDAQSIAVRHDEGPASQAAWDRNTLSDLSFLRANGFSEEDYPTEEERMRRLLEKVVVGAPGHFAGILLPVLYPELADVLHGSVMAEDNLNVPIDKQMPQPATPAAKETPGAPPAAPPTGGPNEAQPAPPAPAAASIGQLLDRLATAADAALERALERAGNRAMSLAAKRPEVRDRLRGAPKGMVLSAITDADIEELGLTRAELVNDAWDNFTLRGAGWVRDWLIAEGESSFVADEIAGQAMKDVAKHLDEWLEGGIGRDIPVGQNGLRVPYGLISEPLVDAMSRFSGLL